ncbi:lactaldehyde reductase [Actinomyces succiniciruminis]|uniref:Lactaldehyde reductase n=1 Tax=Actinomyces succiniciruminis TaxID=1522002 RepID=A0A1L7RNX4_9ACTO|nr:lactaldehyde reductase [Actinomyces succiniciruminis]CED91188.1 Lactaldehyde reductase [Actinomyces succiniciruminis]
MTYRMIFNQTGYFGRGAIANIPTEITARGLSKAFIVTDPVLAENGTAARITDLLDAAGIAWEIFSDVVPNPPVEKVQAGLAAFRNSGADILIGLGGGSPQDTCKAISVIATNPEFEDVLSLEGASPTKHPGTPIIGLPTTAGTASETTINYVITDTANQRKFVCVDPHDIPVIAVVDPDLMDGMPRGLKVATGLDALTHAIEGYITPGAWELSDALCLRSIQMIAKNLRKAAEGDADAVEQMGLAAYINGMAYSNVGLGLVHGMAHPLGGRYNAPHGVANGILLAPIMAYNAEYTGEKYRDIAEAFGVADAQTMPLDQARQAAVDAVAQLTRDLGNPTRISEVGVDESGIAALTEDAFADVCTPGNPRPATRENIEALYRSLL